MCLLDSIAVYAHAKRGLTWTPTVPFTSTKVALWNFFSTSWTSGSLYVRPISRFKPPMVLRKFEVSSVFAASPRDRCFGPKETSDLSVHTVSKLCKILRAAQRTVWPDLRLHSR